MHNSLSYNLNILMTNKKISSSKLGEIIDIPAATIRKLRTGENNNPTLNTLSIIANYFKITISQLVGEQSFNSCFLIPLLTWENAILWSKNKSPIKININVETEFELSDIAYALYMDSDINDVFQQGCVMIIDPKVKYFNSDYIIVHKLGQAKPSVKKFIEDEGSFYIQSLVKGINTIVPLTTEYEVLGVVIGYIYNKWFKTN